MIYNFLVRITVPFCEPPSCHTPWSPCLLYHLWEKNWLDEITQRFLLIFREKRGITISYFFLRNVGKHTFKKWYLNARPSLQYENTRNINQNAKSRGLDQLNRVREGRSNYNHHSRSKVRQKVWGLSLKYNKYGSWKLQAGSRKPERRDEPTGKTNKKHEKSNCANQTSYCVL